MLLGGRWRRVSRVGRRECVKERDGECTAGSPPAIASGRQAVSYDTSDRQRGTGERIGSSELVKFYQRLL